MKILQDSLEAYDSSCLESCCCPCDSRWQQHIPHSEHKIFCLLYTKVYMIISMIYVTIYFDPLIWWGYEGLFHYQREFLEWDRIINFLTAAGWAKCATLPCHHSLDSFSYLGFITFSFILCVQENTKSQINQSTTKINPKLSMGMLSGERGGQKRIRKGKDWRGIWRILLLSHKAQSRLLY